MPSTGPIGIGTYTATEAARLAGMPASRVRRWLKGYEYVTTRGARRSQPSVWLGELPSIDGYLELGFRDLMELRAVNAFLEAGVSWSLVRKAHAKGEELVGHAFPFSTDRFCTDGNEVFAMLREEDETGFANVLTGQGYFRKLLSPLIVQLDFGKDGLPLVWHPRGRTSRVVVDPERGFGRPIVSLEGVPTSVLAAAVWAGDSRATVRRWFRVSAESLRDALAFEKKLAA